MLKKLAVAALIIAAVTSKSTNASLTPGKNSLANSMAAQTSSNKIILNQTPDNKGISYEPVLSANGTQGSLANSMAAQKSAVVSATGTTYVPLNQTPNNTGIFPAGSLNLGTEQNLLSVIPHTTDNRPLGTILATDERFAPFLNLVKTNPGLFQAVQKASNSAPLTLFVPAKDVFNKLALLKPQILEMLKDSKLGQEVQQLLKLHAAEGEFLSLASRALSTEPASLKTSKTFSPIKTVGNVKLPFAFNANKLTLGNSEVVGVIKAQNGTIFLVDNLLTHKLLGTLHEELKDLAKNELENGIRLLKQKLNNLNVK